MCPGWSPFYASQLSLSLEFSCSVRFKQASHICMSFIYGTLFLFFVAQHNNKRAGGRAERRINNGIHSFDILS